MQYGSGILRCTVCETTVEVLEQTGPELVCCGRVMEERIKNTDYCGGEDARPVVEQIAGGIRVNVGAYEHPMTARHHIQWIEVVADGRLERQYLRPGMPPCGKFTVQTPRVVVRGCCTLHGLWTKEKANVQQPARTGSTNSPESSVSDGGLVLNEFPEAGLSFLPQRGFLKQVAGGVSLR